MINERLWTNLLFCPGHNSKISSWEQEKAVIKVVFSRENIINIKNVHNYDVLHTYVYVNLAR